MVLINVNKTKYNCWIDAKHSIEKETIEHDISFNFDVDLFDATISKLIYLTNFNFLKEF